MREKTKELLKRADDLQLKHFRAEKLLNREDLNIKPMYYIGIGLTLLAIGGSALGIKTINNNYRTIEGKVKIETPAGSAEISGSAKK